MGEPVQFAFAVTEMLELENAEAPDTGIWPEKVMSSSFGERIGDDAYGDPLMLVPPEIFKNHNCQYTPES